MTITCKKAGMKITDKIGGHISNVPQFLGRL